MAEAAPARSLAIALAACLLGACAATPNGAGNPDDPLESFNRPIHAFNDAVDRNALQPVARGYRTVVPGPVDTGISNFFDNLDDILVLFNSALQLKPRATAITTSRLFVNTTIGLAGVIDVAGMMGATKQNEDFGQTLGYWGVDRGPYLVLPLLGPSTLRDTGGLVVDYQIDPVDQIGDSDTWLAAQTLRVVDRRAALLGATDVLDTAAVDPYAFTRDAFLRRRANQVHDGNPPPDALPGGGADDAASEAEEAFDPFSSEDDDLFEDP
jgi:phospholipid-binding lipoprotein MlaA